MDEGATTSATAEETTSQTKTVSSSLAEAEAKMATTTTTTATMVRLAKTMVAMDTAATVTRATIGSHHHQASGVALPLPLLATTTINTAKEHHLATNKVTMGLQDMIRAREEAETLTEVDSIADNARLTGLS